MVVMTVSEASKPGVCNFLWKGRVEFSQPHIFSGSFPPDSPFEPLVLQRAGLEPQAGPSHLRHCCYLVTISSHTSSKQRLYNSSPIQSYPERLGRRKGTKSQGLTWEAAVSVESPPSGKGGMQFASEKAPNDFTFTSSVGIPIPNKQAAPPPPLDPQLTLDRFPRSLSRFSPHTQPPES